MWYVTTTVNVCVDGLSVRAVDVQGLPKRREKRLHCADGGGRGQCKRVRSLWKVGIGGTSVLKKIWRETIDFGYNEGWVGTVGGNKT
jgi:hypothetical protein